MIIRTLLFVLFTSFLSFQLSAQSIISVGVESTIPGIFNGKTIPLRDYQESPNVINEIVKEEKLGITGRDWPLHPAVNRQAKPKGVDPALQKSYTDSNASKMSAVDQNYNGMGYTNVNPADPSMDVSANHVIQMINGGSGSYFKIWDKTGTVIINQTYFDNYMGLPGGAGDPIVIYDQIADRWLLSEFAAAGNHLHVAISVTNDPTGSWYTYIYDTPSFPDYPKYSIWNDGYYVTSNENTSKIYALDRDEMLNGNAGVMQEFSLSNFPTIGFQAATPVNLDGSLIPPSGTPAYFMRMADDAWSGSIPADRLEMYELDVDFDTPSNSVLSGGFYLPTMPFDTELCGYTSFSCIDQPGSTNLDPLREVLMNKIMYRNFGSYESIVCNHVTDVDDTDHAGVRWYELRRFSGEPWEIYQQGTYSPNAENRWMAAIAINEFGDIGLAYNVAGSSMFPSLRYTGRRKCDPLGTMTITETNIVTGTASNGSNRFGDYNSMSVDPTDGKFWFTGMYNPASQWSTRVASFDIEPNPTPCPEVQFYSNSKVVSENQATISDGNCTDYVELNVIMGIKDIPSQDANITLNLSGSASVGSGLDYEISPMSFDLGAFNQFQSITIKIYNDALIESDETIIVDYTLNNNGGDAYKGASNQTFEVNIMDDDLMPQNIGGEEFIIDFADFESGLGSYTTQNPSNDDPFTTSNASGASSSSWTVPNSNATQIAFVNDDDCNCDMDPVYLISPIFNVSAFSSLNLNFDTYYEGNTYQGDSESANLEISVNGSPFSSILSIPGLDGNWQNIDVDLDSYAGNAQVQFRFSYSDGTGWLYGLAIDNVKLSTQSSVEIQTQVNLNNSTVHRIGPNQSIYFFDAATNKTMAKIDNLSNHDFGCVEVFVQKAGISHYQASDYIGDIIDKNLIINAENPSPTAPFELTLYYILEELDDWMIMNNAACDDLNQLYMVRSDGNIEDETGLLEMPSTTSAITYNGEDYEFTGNFTGAMGGFALADERKYPRFYVNQNATGMATGSSWANGYISLQDALDEAFTTTCNQDFEIWMAAGTYYATKDSAGAVPADMRDATFYLNQEIVIRGSFIGDLAEAENLDINLRDFQNQSTILSGDVNQDDGPNFMNYTDNNYHVLLIESASGTALLDGLTIQAGNGQEGSGIYALSNADIYNMVIQACQSSLPGSAVYATGSNTLLIVESLDTENNDPADVNAVNGAEIRIKGEHNIKE